MPSTCRGVDGWFKRVETDGVVCTGGEAGEETEEAGWKGRGETDEVGGGGS